MKSSVYTMNAKLWLWQGNSPWHFFTVNEKVSMAIRSSRKGRTRRGFGSVRVKAKIGNTVWKTSIFPTKDGPYLLPVKAAIRKKEELLAGDIVVVSIVLSN